MLAVVFGLLSALVYGFADFAGGLGAKRLGSLRLSWVSILAGAVTITAFFFITGGNWAVQATPDALLWGGLSGLVGSFALLFLYAALALGPMSILSPLSALVAAIFPVAWDFAAGTQLRPLSYVAIVIALIAVVLVGTVRENTHVRPSVRGLFFAVMAGLLIGAYVIFINMTPDTSGVVPFIANRTVGFVVMTIVLGGSMALRWMRQRGHLGRVGVPRADVVVGERGAVNWRVGVWLGIATGALDTIANTLLLFGLRVGDLSVVSVLTSLYPAGTVVLALVVLRERLTWLQATGMVLAVVAAAMLSVA